MAEQMESLEPGGRAGRAIRRRLPLRAELVLALLPTAMVLVVLAFVEALSHQRLLFASLASSAFLIYLDPQHGTNSLRTLTVSHLLAALLGWGSFMALGSGYLSAGSAMVATIALMIVLDVVHPPAVSTAMSFALRAGDAGNLLLFGLSLGIIAALVVLERTAVWMLARHQARAAAA
ncbi:MAG TPA: HPP family protein [Longimicrobiaceae bacterium]|jgi:CBS-domain-containing membrane protein